MTLTAIQAKNAKPKDKDYKLFDEKGMFLLVKLSGANYWRLKYRFAGKEKLLALGVYDPEDGVSLADARSSRSDARKLLKRGVDPGLERKKRKLTEKTKASTYFEDIARDWISIKSKQWSARQTRDVTHQMEKDIFPDIGTLPIDQISQRSRPSGSGH